MLVKQIVDKMKVKGRKVKDKKWRPKHKKKVENKCRGDRGLIE